MQYLKEETKNKIISEALKEFKLKGYNKASVRVIAKNSQTSVGNIYKYFESKEDLYKTLIGDVYNKIIEYITALENVKLDEKAEYIFAGLLEKIMKVFETKSTELAILFNGSEGTIYESCKIFFTEWVTGTVTKKINYDVSFKSKKLKDNFIIYLLACNLVESIAIILNEKEDGREVKRYISNIIEVLFCDIEDKLELEDL